MRICQDKNECSTKWGPYSVFGVLTIVFHLLVSGLVSAETQKVQLDVIPGTIEFESDGAKRHAFVVLRNQSTEYLSNIRLSWFTDTEGMIETDGPTLLKSLGPQSDISWKLTVTKTGKKPLSGSISLLIDYSRHPKGQSTSVTGVTVGSLAVKTREAQERIADVQLKAPLEALNEQHAGKGYLIVTNKYHLPINVKVLSYKAPDFIKIESPSTSWSIDPDKVAIIEVSMNVNSTSRIQPGKQLIIFEIQLEWKTGNLIESSNQILSQEVNVGVLGESEILTLLGVPSFLFLPGFLVLITWKILWERGFLKLREDLSQFIAQPKSPEFWLIAVTLSLFVGIFFVVVDRSYLQGYNLNDMVIVWLFSVFALGIGGYILFMGLRTEYVRRRVPSESDDPITLLRKLAKQKLTLLRRRATVQIAGINHDLFLFQERAEEREAFWVGPPVQITWLRTENFELQTLIDEQISKRGKPDELAGLLEKGQEQGDLEVKWKKVKAIESPYQAKKSDRIAYQQPEIMVETS